MTPHRFILSAVTMILCAGCVEPIILDPEEEMPLVVNCVLERPYEWWWEMDESQYYQGYPADKVIPTQYLDLVYARRPSETEVRKMDDAEVCIFDGRNQLYEFKWNGDRYECAFLPRYGMNYQLEITTPDGGKIRASTIFPARVRLQKAPLISTLSQRYTYSGFFYSESLYEDITVRELSPGYQEIIVTEEYRPFLGPYKVWVSASEGSGEPGIPIMTNHPEADDFNVMGGDWPTENNMSFQEADFNMFTSSGFAPGWDKESSAAVWALYKDAWTKSLAHDKFVRIHQTSDMPSIFEEDTQCTVQSVQRDSRLLFTLNAEFDYEKDIANHQEVGYLCRFVSDEYDRFLKDVAGKFLIHGDEFASYYSEDPVYSNIIGAKGIFGAVSHTSTTFSWR